ncbi:MAG: hypothetical protein J6Q17_08895 [Clostridia bacterium]|nr:hypothetical protein [Clostridia bacterium]
MEAKPYGRNRRVLLAAALFFTLFRAVPVPAGAEGTDRDAGIPKEERAEAAAREILGDHVRLETAILGGDILFSCPNGYVRADLTTGRASEWSVCFAGGGNRLTSGECRVRALAFLAQRYGEGWTVTELRTGEDGICEIDAARDGEGVRMTLMRDSGTVCFFLFVPDPGGRDG